MTTPTEPRLRAPDPPAPSPAADDERRSFVRWLTIITIAGFAVRLAYVLLVRRNHVPGGDAFFYHVMICQAGFLGGLGQSYSAPPLRESEP